MLITTYYPISGNGRNPMERKDIEYLLAPRVGDVVVVNEIEYKVEAFIHDTDTNELSMILRFN